MKRGLKKLHICILFTIILLLILQGLVLGQEMLSVDPTARIAREVINVASEKPLSSTNVIALSTSMGDTSEYYFSNHVYLCVEKCNITIIAGVAYLTIRLKICNKTDVTLNNVILKLRKREIGVCGQSIRFESPTDPISVHYGNIAIGGCGSSSEEFIFTVHGLSNTEPLCLHFNVLCQLYLYGTQKEYNVPICQNTVISVSKGIKNLLYKSVIMIETAAIGWLIYDKLKK